MNTNLGTAIRSRVRSQQPRLDLQSKGGAIISTSQRYGGRTWSSRVDLSSSSARASSAVIVDNNRTDLPSTIGTYIDRSKIAVHCSGRHVIV